jgi:hypothetical protein
MATSDGGPLTASLNDLQNIFGDRLLAVVAYGQPGATPAPSLALVRTVTATDLERCASHAAAWQRAGCATPLLLTPEEFAGSLDAFPIEYGEILDTRRLVHGVDPFAGLSIKTEDVRREIETLVKSHLVHLRENFIECRGRQVDITALVTEAAPAFALLLRRLARFDGFPADSNSDLNSYAVARPLLDPRTVGDLLALAQQRSAAGVDGVRLYPAYLNAVEQLWQFIDRWKSE